jgi:hypothetical protein
MIDIRRVADRATKWRGKVELRHTLRILETKCTGARQAPAGASDLARAILRMTSWPSSDDLSALDSSVKTLSLSDRKKVPKPLWEAFELVNQRWPGFRLIHRLDTLVSRARNLLKEAGESDLMWVRREARGSGERALEAKKFLEDLRRLQKDPKTAAKIKWEHYERFLSKPGLNKGVQLWCGDHPASAGVVYYARALEMVVDDEYHRRLLDDAEPLLRWIACLGNRAYRDALKWDDFMEGILKWLAERVAEERVEHKRAQARQRQRRFRSQKIAR